MRYPTLTYSRSDELVKRFVAGETPSVVSDVSWSGSGDEVDLDVLDRTVSDLRADWEARSAAGAAVDPEVFEGEAAGPLHRALRDLPVELLDDPGFWRYLSIGKLWWFVSRREEGPIGRGNHMTYVDGGRPTECVPLRMFLRAQAIRDGDDYALASSMDNATDFWRSHVIRVQTGTAPPLARSFARLQAEKRMPTTPELRPFARRLNRLWSNVVLNRIDEADADELLDELYRTRRSLADDDVDPA